MSRVLSEQNILKCSIPTGRSILVVLCQMSYSKSQHLNLFKVYPVV